MRACRRHTAPSVHYGARATVWSFGRLSLWSLSTQRRINGGREIGDSNRGFESTFLPAARQRAFFEQSFCRGQGTSKIVGIVSQLFAQKCRAFGLPRRFMGSLALRKERRLRSVLAGLGFRFGVGSDFFVIGIFTGHRLGADGLELDEVLGEEHVERPGEGNANLFFEPWQFAEINGAP